MVHVEEDRIGVHRCPSCDGALTSDPRFVMWCPGCDWNIDPLEKRDERSRRSTRLLRRVAQRNAMSVFADVTSGASRRPQWDGAWVASHAVALVVHAMTLAVFVLAVVLAVLSRGNAIGLFFAAGVAAYGILLRPRLGRCIKVSGKRKAKGVVARDAAPDLYALVDGVAADVGAKPVDVIVMDLTYNASFGVYGLRRQRVMTIGIPLWAMLGPSERLALLAHELGHSVNGDARRGLFVGTALQSLAEWHTMMRPQQHVVRRSVSHNAGMSIAEVAERFVHLLQWPLCFAIGWIWRAELWLSLRGSQRAEYLADELSVRVAGQDATLNLLDATLIAPLCERAAPRLARQSQDLWQAQRDNVAGLPESERLRLTRIEGRRPYSLDQSHPHHRERSAFVRSLPSDAPRRIVTQSASDAIDRELAGWYAGAERTIRERAQ